MNNRDKNPIKFHADGLPGLLDVPGNTLELVGGFFEAAAQFYQAAPWMRLYVDQPLAATLGSSGGSRYILLIGAGGHTVAGLILCDTWEDVLSILDEGVLSAKNRAEPQQGGTLTFVEEKLLPAADRIALRALGDKGAGPSVYPLPIMYRADDLERPDAEELVFFTAALHAIPAFVSDQLEPDESGDYLAVEAEYEVQVQGEAVHLTLRYPAQGPLGDREIAEQLLEMSAEQREAAALGHQAWNETDTERRLALAQQALALSPDAADAYTVLAEEAEYPQEALEWLEKAVAAGEAWLTPEALERLDGVVLWAAPAVRPFLRARLALAETLEQLGRPEDALRHYLRLLELNPADHPGARYPALALLVRLKRDTEARELIERYKFEEAVDWDYTRALLAFRSGGDSAQARRRLQKAIRRNPAVAEYLTAARPLPLDPAETAESAAEEEAYEYALHNYPSWWSTQGAINWLKKVNKNKATPQTGRSAGSDNL